MTSAQLSARIQHSPLFRSERLPFNPDEAFVQASFAQSEIARELLCLRETFNLVLVSGQETYEGSVLTVTDATNASPIVITTSSVHGLQTGDSVRVVGVLGNTAANGFWPAVTRVDGTRFSLDGSSGNAAYTSGGKAAHPLFSTLLILNARKTSPSTGIVHFRTETDVEVYRPQYTSPAATDEVAYYYVRRSEPIVLGFQGVPGETIKTEFSVCRKLLDAENITDTQDPVLGTDLDELLVQGTLWRYLMNQDIPDAHVLASPKMEAWYAMLAAERRRRAIQSHQFQQTPPSLRVR